MVEAPEKIWAAATPYSVNMAYAVKPPEQYLVGYTEYLRADIAERQIAELLAENKELRRAGQRVLDGLHARIDTAPRTSVPVFDGIVDLHDALNHAAALSAKDGRP